jgi:hypothetical protein
VPEIELFAVGEQVAVTGNDLVLELAGLSELDGAGAREAAIEAAGPLPGDTVIWTRTGRQPLSAVIDELMATLRELRLGL